jgi:hypothetical protein
VELFRSRDAVRVVAPSDLASAFLDLMANENPRQELGRRVADTLDGQRGATQRTLQKLNELLAPQSQGAKPA